MKRKYKDWNGEIWSKPFCVHELRSDLCNGLMTQDGVSVWWDEDGHRGESWQKIHEPYRGITYFKLLECKFIKWLWRLLFCKKQIHLFDEVWSGDRHYLNCDACGLLLHIDFFEERIEFELLDKIDNEAANKCKEAEK